MSGLGMLGMQAASQGMGALLGLALQKQADRRQLEQQGKLQKLQIAGSKELTDFQTQKQLEMWRATSYPAQLAMMKEAGLNPSLMYGGAGSGGSTNISTGNVASGNAPTGGGEIQAMMGMALQRDMQKAQIENLKAQTEKTKAETTAVGPGIEKTKMETSSLSQGINNQKAQEELLKLDYEIKSVENEIAGKTQNAQIAIIQTSLSKMTKELEILNNQKLLTDTEVKYKDKEYRYNLANVVMDTWLKSEQGKAASQSVQESIRRVQNMIQDNMRSWDRMSNENVGSEKEIYERAMNDNSFPEELKGLIPGLILNPGKMGNSHKSIKGFHNR